MTEKPKPFPKLHIDMALRPMETKHRLEVEEWYKAFVAWLQSEVKEVCKNCDKYTISEIPCSELYQEQPCNALLILKRALEAMSEK